MEAPHPLSPSSPPTSELSSTLDRSPSSRPSPPSLPRPERADAPLSVDPFETPVDATKSRIIVGAPAPCPLISCSAFGDLPKLGEQLTRGSPCAKLRDSQGDGEGKDDREGDGEVSTSQSRRSHLCSAPNDTRGAAAAKQTGGSTPATIKLKMQQSAPNLPLRHQHLHQNPPAAFPAPTDGHGLTSVTASAAVQEAGTHLRYGTASVPVYHPSTPSSYAYDHQPHQNNFSTEPEGDPPSGEDPRETPSDLNREPTTPVGVAYFLNERYHSHPAHQIRCQSSAVKAMNGEKGRPPTQVEIKKGLHTLSEQRRRWSINEGYEHLRSIVPQCDNGRAAGAIPKAAVLSRAANYIGDLTVYINQLREALKDRDDRIRDLIQANANVGRTPSSQPGYTRNAPAHFAIPNGMYNSPVSTAPTRRDSVVSQAVSNYDSSGSSVNLVSPASATFPETASVSSYGGPVMPPSQQQTAYTSSASTNASPTGEYFGHSDGEVQTFRAPSNTRTRSATFPAGQNAIQAYTQPEYRTPSDANQYAEQDPVHGHLHHVGSDTSQSAYLPNSPTRQHLKRKESPLELPQSQSYSQVRHVGNGQTSAPLYVPNKRTALETPAFASTTGLFLHSPVGTDTAYLPRNYLQMQHETPEQSVHTQQ